MHLSELLHKTFKEQLPQVHKTRLNNLMKVSEVAVTNNKLYLAGLGRSLINENKECSNIQKVDRLLGNGHLQAERISFYKVMLSQVVKGQSSIWIHIDWTCINSVTNLYVLRASISMPGRSMTLYEECHSKKKENNHATHKAFLDQLKTLLPPTVKPIIVTDAGFRGSWFAYILKLGWNFVGRLRNKNAISIDGGSNWTLSSSYFEKATGKPTFIGQGLLTEEGKVPANFVLYKGKAKGRVLLNRNKKRSKAGMSKRYAKAHKEPWLLVTSLNDAILNPLLIATIYKQRMRIEENIRDTKCSHYGLGLKDSLTRCPNRMHILLLIAAIATFIAWLAGLYISYNGRASDFQSQSSKFTSVLSLVFLGRTALKKNIYLTKEQFEHILRLLYHLAILTQNEILQNG